MVNFDLQRFDDVVAYGPKWIFTDDNVDGFKGEPLYFVPAGKTYTIRYEDARWYGETLHNVPRNYPNGDETITIQGLSSVPNPDTSTTVTATAYNVSNVTVTGSDAPLLRITIDGVEYMADETGHLVPAPTAVDISGNAWYALHSDQTTWGWLASDSTTANEGYLDDNDSAVTVWISGVSSVTGSATSATAVLASGVAVSGVTVTGSVAGTVTITINGVEYEVDSAGKLQRKLPNLGLMTKADKQKLDGINSSTYLTTAAAASTYLGKTAKAASASTADALTTRRVLYISDRGGKNIGPGVFFSGTANATIKMPDTAVFAKLTTTNLVLGTTASTTEGAMWLEWS